MAGRVPSKLIDWDLELLHATEALRGLAEAFHTARFGLGELLAIVALASAVLWVEELRKLVVRHRNGARRDP